MSSDKDFRINLDVKVDVEALRKVLIENAHKIIKTEIAPETKEEKRMKVALKQREDLEKWTTNLTKKAPEGVVAYDKKGNQIRFEKDHISINGEIVYKKS